MNAAAQAQAAREFAAKWKGRGYEKGESQKFWMELLRSVYGVENPADLLVFEQQVQLDHTSFIDVMIPMTHVMIEQKSLGKKLTDPIRQSDGTLLKPIEQARRYAAALPYSARPRWIVSCNFAQFLVYDMETPNAEPQEILLAVQKEPKSTPYFREWYGAQEFLHRQPRYCLWLGDCPPHELRQMPHCRARVEAVREFRQRSPRAATRRIADKPTRFLVENMPEGHFIIMPKVSSERRGYIPCGFMDNSVLCSDLVFLIPHATLYHFGILTSNVHMAWMRTVAGRLKSDYRYSKDIVYNNFPWCTPTDEQRAAIEKTAQGILDARARYPESSLADLYDDVTMPPDLREAHRANDRAVMRAYGFSTKLTESACVAELMKRYEELVQRGIEEEK